MSQRTLHWPRRIARADRTPLSIGHGSFVSQRFHVGDAAFDRQCIRLSGYLLILAHEGSVILDRGERSILLLEGDAALVPAGEFTMTENPRPRFSHGVTRFTFFNQRTLADLICNQEGLAEIAARISLPAAPFYPVERLGDALRARTVTSSFDAPTHFSAVFTGLLAARPAMVCTFLKHAVFVPRVRLCLFLEGQCLGKVNLRAIAASYPDGAAAFRRDCSNYLDRPVAQWLFRRRIERARHWLRYTDRTEDEVAAQLGYRDRRRFRSDMKRYGRFSPLELKTLRLFSPKEADPLSRLPFWFPEAEALIAKRRQLTLDMITLGTLAPSLSMQRALLARYTGPKPASAWMPEVPPLCFPQAKNDTAEPDQQEASPDNVITLQMVEGWQTGKSSLGVDSRLLALAA